MKIVFEKVILHNFLSFGHSEIDLGSKGYCRVIGENKCVSDNSHSNGSGKSSIWSAITYALTGLTVQGISSCVKNVNVDEKSCYVSLFFSVDDKQYQVIRYKEPKSNLEVYVDGEDKSGKGIRETEEILNSLLPDLTQSLLCSVIIIGQGMPNKFTDNTPSGRKEVLEKLTKSDFMIQDIKEKVSERLEFIQTRLSDIACDIRVYNGEIETIEKNVESTKSSLQELSNIRFDAIGLIEKELRAKSDEKEKLNLSILDLSKRKDIESENLNGLLADETKELDDESACYIGAKEIISENLSKLQADLMVEEAEYKKLSNMKDVCPTCGQKLPNVILPDLSKNTEIIKKLKDDISILMDKKTKCESNHTLYVKDIRDSFKETKEFIKGKIDSIMKEQSKLQEELRSIESYIKEKENELTKLKTMRDCNDELLHKYEKEIMELSKKIKEKRDIVANKEKEQLEFNKSKDIVSKISTLVKRDFRGYLLRDIINFIDTKAKEYCKVVFNNTELGFELDGNNINITFLGKPIENLSGGEQQKINIIIQLAIRDMLYRFMGFTSNIIVLDEIFDALDNIGSNNIITLIDKVLRDVDSVFIISHRADELGIPYDTELRVIKNELSISMVV